MDRKMILSVLAIAVFGFAGTMLLIPEDRDDGVPRLPWLVSTDAQGRSQVFGFTLGATTLAEVREVFGEEGKINLFARESDLRWKNRTIVARDLDLDTWYSFVLDVDVEEAVYRVKIDGVTDWFELESFYYKDETPAEITHMSFASWNDGAGTFYVDNVSAESR